MISEATQAYLLTERKLAVGSVVARETALRFFFVRNPQAPRVPGGVAVSEGSSPIADGAEPGGGRSAYRCYGNLMQRALLMTLYGTGMRRTRV